MRKAVQTAQDHAEIQLVCFKLGPDEYGLDIMYIKEVIRYQRIKQIPKAPAFIEGVINLRGMVIPIVDLRKRFSISGEVNVRNKVIIAQVENRIIGLVVDDVTDIITLPKDSVLPAPRIIRGAEVDYLDGMVEREENLLLILNTNKILTSEESGTMDKHSLPA